jgi:hypothetical protein
MCPLQICEMLGKVQPIRRPLQVRRQAG